MDIENAQKVIEGIEKKDIKIEEITTLIPSPFAFNLVAQGHFRYLKDRGAGRILAKNASECLSKKYRLRNNHEKNLKKESANNLKMTEKDPNEGDKEDIYEEENVEQDLEDDEISPGEAGFMEGYDRDLGKKDELDEDEDSDDDDEKEEE